MTTNARYTATLFASLNVADATVISTRQQQHRPQEELKLLKSRHHLTSTCVSSSATMLTHNHAPGQAWLRRCPRIQVHFTPTNISWLNMVERFFRDITTKRLR
ncbi:hypothetical protein [Verrucomicrobium spinosum]|uniref:hypothetical protein n=1 Tax=Verrucomicrobium spinosum TaxID=2736 RepID=UPI001C46C612|nr:hypothetical protein [Verrucomicrobium spinosum]